MVFGNLTQSSIMNMPSQVDYAADSATYSNFINSPTEADLQPQIQKYHTTNNQKLIDLRKKCATMP